MSRKIGQVLVGKGCQRMYVTDTGIQVSDTMQHMQHTGYVLLRALVLEDHFTGEAIKLQQSHYNLNILRGHNAEPAY